MPPVIVYREGEPPGVYREGEPPGEPCVNGDWRLGQEPRLARITLAHSDQPFAQSPEGSLGAVAHTDLAEDVLDVFLDRLVAEL